MTYTQSTTNKPAQSTSGASPCGCGCGCHDHPPHTGECCGLTCFERPNYFCGQLLSDADLTLQENYFREKNKLYHRTIDGYGVVCGLRLKCDGRCNGHITIGEGYAIDCCGNDLIVCKQESFDVIGELRKKKWLLEPCDDPCKDKSKYQNKDKDKDKDKDQDKDKDHHRDEDDGCLYRQCFYIGICYSEEPSTYVTPYTTDCSPGPGPCQPTRVRECVSFEIYDKIPCRPNPLVEIEKRIERCFRIFREGQFSRGLQQLAPIILTFFDCDANPQAAPQQDPDPGPTAQQAFVELRALFLHQIRICPDEYNCNLEHEVCRLRPPGDPNNPKPTVEEAFTRLLELIEKYVFSCVLAELAFLCPEPDPCCVLIGAVEIENGRLVRVINYPRWYLWCFANFFEVLIYTLANEAACSRTETEINRNTPGEVGGLKPPPPKRTDGCCPTPEVSVCNFLHLFIKENRAHEYAARASAQAMQAVRASLVSGFNFMRPDAISPTVFNNMSIADAQDLAKQFKFNLASLGKPPSEAQDPVAGLLSRVLHTGTDPMALFQETRKDAQGADVQVATGATRIMDAPALSVGTYNYEAVSTTQSMQAAKIKELSDSIAKLSDEIKALKNPGGAPPTEGNPGGPQ